MAWINLSEAEQAEIKELDRMSDRAAAIVGATMIDARLLDLLKMKLLDLQIKADSSLHNRMFGNSQPLGSFSARINLGYMLKLYDETSWRDLDLIREVRNDFAHKTEFRSFEHQSIKDRCGRLKACDNFLESTEGSSSMEMDDLAVDRFPTMKFYLAGAEERRKWTKGRFLFAIQYYAMLLKFLPTLVRWGNAAKLP